ncbi:UNVERIFIED_CONTAM: hypothetical protein HHA_239475 [Hammondia hammondi]|eukprot:XP_008887488.1 hypothetical protein HHA_239475 [Hammondia hammondi]
MADWMLAWVNSFPLSRKVVHLESDFASGFLFGELLVAVKQLDNIGGFLDSSAASAVVRNFCLLEPVFRRLDIKFDSVKMQAIIEAREGAALRVLFQLKVALSRFSRNCGRTTSDLARVLRPTAHAPAFEAFQARCVEARLKEITKTSAEAETHRVLRNAEIGQSSWKPGDRHAQTRTNAAIKNEPSHEVSASPLSRTGHAHFPQREHTTRVDRGQGRHRAERPEDPTAPGANRSGRVSSKPTRDKKEKGEERDEQRGEQGEERRGQRGQGERDEREKRREVEAEILRRRVLLEARVREERLSRAQAKERDTREAVKKDIETFEMNLQRLGLSHSGSAGVSVSGENLRSPDSLLTSLSKLASPSFGRQENLKMLARLHAARRAQEVARKERDKRRQKLLMEQTQAHANRFAETVSEGVFRRFRRLPSRAERVEESVWQVQQLDTVMSQNRELRDSHEQRVAARERQVRDARQLHVSVETQERLRREVALEAQQCREWKKQRKAKRRASLIEECSGILDLFVDLAVAAARFHQDRDLTAVDSRTWRAWLVGFVEGVSPLPTQSSQAPRFLSESKNPTGFADALFGEHVHADHGEGFALGDASKGKGEETTASEFHRLLLSPEFLRFPGAQDCPKGEAALSPAGPQRPRGTGPLRASEGLHARLNEDDFLHYLNSAGEFDAEETRQTMPQAFAFLRTASVDGETQRDLFDAEETVEELRRFNEVSAGDLPQTEIVKQPNGEPALYRIGSIVGTLLDLLHSEAPLQPPEEIPRNALKIVITGKPFSGKKTLAKKLGQRFRLHVFSLEDVLKESLEGIDRGAGLAHPVEVAQNTSSPLVSPPTDLESTHTSTQGDRQPPSNRPSSPPSFSSSSSSPLTGSAPSSSCATSASGSSSTCVPTLRALGAEAFEALRRGEKLRDELSVSLLVAKMRTFPDVDREALVHFLEAGARKDGESLAKEKATASRGRGPQKPGKEKPSKETVGEENQQKLGWILVGFPQTYEQCVSLEEQLSGYVSPDRRQESRARVEKSNASLVVPIPEGLQSETSLIPGGVDLHILLDVPTEEVLLRARNSLQLPKPRDENNGILENALSKIPTDDAGASQTKISIADECCHFEIEQKVTQLFLKRFGSPDGQPRLLALPPKPENELFLAVSEKIEALLARKRREFELDTHADSGEAHGTSTEKKEDKWLSEESEEQPLDTDCLSPRPLPEPPEVFSSSTSEFDESSLWRRRLERLEEPVKQLLLAEWRALQEDYTSSLSRLFAWHRRVRDDISRSLVDLQIHFVDLLDSPDNKQELVDAFLQDYNAFAAQLHRSMRLEAVKEELHQQVDDLSDALWQQIDARRSDAVAEHKQLSELGWIETICQVLAVQTEAFVDAEIRRYLALERFVTDAYYNVMGACMPERRQTPDVAHALREISLAVAQQVVCAFFPGPLPDGAAEPPSAKTWQAHLLEGFEAKARECLIPLSEFEDYTPSLQESEKKKTAKARAVKEEAKKPANTVFFELQHLRLELQLQLLWRVRKACVWGIARLHETASACSDTFARMDDWIVGKCLAEHAAVKELTDRLKICIENERPVPHYMELAGTQLRLDPNAILCPPTQALPPLRIAEIPDDIFTVKQINEFVWDLKHVTTNGIVSTMALREILLRRLTHSKCFRTPHLPQSWLTVPVSQLSLLPDYFDVSSGCVDPLEFLLSLALGACGWPSERQLLQLRSSVGRVCTARECGSPAFEASPLEVFLSKEEFLHLDFSDWISIDDARKMHEEETQCDPFKDEVPAQGRDLLEALFDTFVAFQNTHNLRACTEDIALLEELGYWKEGNTSAASPSNPSTHANTSNTNAGTKRYLSSSGAATEESSSLAGTTSKATPCQSGNFTRARVSPGPTKTPSFDGRCSYGGDGEANSEKCVLGGDQNAVLEAESGAVNEEASDEEQTREIKCTRLESVESGKDDGGRNSRESKIYMRRFLGYLSLGKTPGEGMQRFLAACAESESLGSPAELRSTDFLSVRDTYTACLFMGVRPALRSLPVCTEISFEEFRQRLQLQKKIILVDRCASGREADICGAEAVCEERVQILDFMSSSVAAEMLSRVGYLSIRRDVKDFLSTDATVRNEKPPKSERDG